MSKITNFELFELEKITNRILSLRGRIDLLRRNLANGRDIDVQESLQKLSIDANEYYQMSILFYTHFCDEGVKNGE